MMKRLTSKLAIVAATLSCIFHVQNASAISDPGPYLGLDLQFSYLNKLAKDMTNGRTLRLTASDMQIDSGAIQSARNTRRGGMGLGFVFGYLLNENFAIETDYMLNKSAVWTDNNFQRLHHQVHLFDVMGKAIWNFTEYFSGNVRLGVTHVNSLVHVGQSFSVSGTNIKGTLLDEGRSFITPTLGLGLSYEFDHNQNLELFIRRIQKHKEVGDITMMGVGFTYNFGEKID